MKQNGAISSCCNSTRRGSPLTEPRPIRVVGAVLTGGASRRMGRAKSLIEVDGVPMARRVAGALRDAGCVSVVAVGGEQEALGPTGLAVLADIDPGGGPLAGIVTALDAYGGGGPDGADWVCVAACDLPALDAQTVRSLVAAAVLHPDADVVVARTDRLEPGCCLWRADVAPLVRGMYGNGVRAVYRVLDELHTVAVDVDPAALRNINTPDDLGRYPGTGE